VAARRWTPGDKFVEIRQAISCRRLVLQPISVTASRWRVIPPLGSQVLVMSWLMLLKRCSGRGETSHRMSVSCGIHTKAAWSSKCTGPSWRCCLFLPDWEIRPLLHRDWRTGPIGVAAPTQSLRRRAWSPAKRCRWWSIAASGLGIFHRRQPPTAPVYE